MSSDVASILQRQSQATAWVQDSPRVRIADGQRKAAERTRLSPEQKKGKSSLPRCVGCLLVIGFGMKRIVRHTGWAKTSVHRWAKFNGVNLSATAEQKKAAEMAVRKRKAEEKRKARLAERARKKAERKTPEQRRAKSIAYYYQHHERNKARSNAYMKRKYAESAPGSSFKIRAKLRSRIGQALKQGGGRKPARTMEIAGCTVPQLKAWLESQFIGRMSWANIGRAWHIDHVMPCASFDLTKPDQVRQCFHYTNLRPMWARANLRKSDKITDPQLNLLLPAA